MMYERNLQPQKKIIIAIPDLNEKEADALVVILDARNTPFVRTETTLFQRKED